MSSRHWKILTAIGCAIFLGACTIKAEDRSLEPSSKKIEHPTQSPVETKMQPQRSTIFIREIAKDEVFLQRNKIARDCSYDKIVEISLGSNETAEALVKAAFQLCISFWQLAADAFLANVTDDAKKTLTRSHIISLLREKFTPDAEAILISARASAAKERRPMPTQEKPLTPTQPSQRWQEKI